MSHSMGASPFDERIDRFGTDSVKWDGLGRIFGRSDALALWVADMDFRAPDPVLKALGERVEHGVFGYSSRPEAYDEAILRWEAERHGWELDRRDLVYIPGVMTGIAKAIQSFSEPGDRVVIQPPVYHPFFDLIRNNGRSIGEAPLRPDAEGRYWMDPDVLERELAKERSKILILCSPHNPVGRIWTREELQKVANLCERYDVLILSDEIHHDIEYADQSHLPIASLDPEIQKRCITFSSPAKTFNLQGLISAFAMVPDRRLRVGLQKALRADHIVLENALSIVACRAAYQEGADWLDELLAYLEGNRDELLGFFRRRDLGIRVAPPDGTYLAWLDCRGLGFSDHALQNFMIEKAGVALNAGSTFGREGEGFMRLNFGCPRSLLLEGLERIGRAIEKT
jgi:cystathionine beta-lyase